MLSRIALFKSMRLETQVKRYKSQAEAAVSFISFSVFTQFSSISASYILLCRVSNSRETIPFLDHLKHSIYLIL